MSRLDDRVRIDSVIGGDFSVVIDRASTYELVSDLLAPSECRFELGDDASWSVLKDALKTGARFAVYVNETQRMRGRLLTKRLPVSPDGGSTIQAVVRTLIADAAYTTAEPKLNLKSATLKDAVLAAYKKLGLTEDDFIFRADLARQLITGKGGKTKPPVDLAAIKEDAAKTTPPETVYAFVERHLNRFHLSHWDGPDGRIVVGAPDDTQSPLYQFRLRRNMPAALANNVLSCEKSEDFENAPTALWVHGQGGGKDVARAKVSWVQPEETLIAVEPSLERIVVLQDESIKTQAQAEARALREMTTRRMSTDAWRITVDGLSYWTGSTSLQYAVDTVCDVQIDSAGVNAGAYLIAKVTMRGDAALGHTTELDVIARGIWRL